MAVLVIGVAQTGQATSYDFSWQGDGGYRLEGSFSYDAAAALDDIVLQSEMTALTVTAFDPSDTALASYDFSQPFSFPMRLRNFNFNTVTQDIPLVGGTNALSIGSFADAAPNWLFTSDLGCGSTFPGAGRGIALWNGDGAGNCSNFTLLDQNLTSSFQFTVSEVPLPASAVLLGGGLILLGGIKRARSAQT